MARQIRTLGSAVDGHGWPVRSARTGTPHCARVVRRWPGTLETLGVTGFPQIVAAENYVIDHHLGEVITQSFAAAPAVADICEMNAAKADGLG